MTNENHANNTTRAVNFIRSLRLHGFINLVAIDPLSGVVIGITRTVSDNAIKDFIAEYNGKQNLYFMVNEPKADSPDNKLRKDHVDKIHAVWLDADPDKTKDFQQERKRLTKFVDELKQSENPPTYIIDSGGGFQAFWFLKTPVNATKDNIRDYEALSRGLAVQYNTDKVQNIDRIMRIPYTLNIPNAKKKKAGRTSLPAKVYWTKSKNGVRYD